MAELEPSENKFVGLGLRMLPEMGVLRIEVVLESQNNFLRSRTPHMPCSVSVRMTRSVELYIKRREERVRFVSNRWSSVFLVFQSLSLVLV